MMGCAKVCGVRSYEKRHLRNITLSYKFKKFIEKYSIMF